MSVRVLVDMNLSPDWVPLLQRQGWAAVHWSAVGDPRDTENKPHRLTDVLAIATSGRSK
jgi:predicted nuclease of predicted toxin-antitoxin system